MVQPTKALDLNRKSEMTGQKPKGKPRAPLIRRNDREWLSLFIQQHKSGKNLADFCKPRGMSPTSFCAKRKILLNKYSIDDLDKLNLNSIDFSKAGGDDIGEPLRQSSDEVEESVTDQVKSPGISKNENSSDQVIRIELTGFTVIIPESNGVEWVADFIPRILKLSSDMQNRR